MSGNSSLSGSSERKVTNSASDKQEGEAKVFAGNVLRAEGEYMCDATEEIGARVQEEVEENGYDNMRAEQEEMASKWEETKRVLTDTKKASEKETDYAPKDSPRPVSKDTWLTSTISKAEAKVAKISENLKYLEKKITDTKNLRKVRQSPLRTRSAMPKHRAMCHLFRRLEM